MGNGKKIIAGVAIYLCFEVKKEKEKDKDNKNKEVDKEKKEEEKEIENNENKFYNIPQVDFEIVLTRFERIWKPIISRGVVNSMLGIYVFEYDTINCKKMY